jgi:hypothetical protein
MLEVEKKITGVENALSQGTWETASPATHLLQTRRFELANHWDIWKR